MDIQLPDGRILRGVPEGTTRAEIEAKLGMQVSEQRKKLLPPAQADVVRPPLPYERLGAAARSGFQGLTMGAGDEIQAGLAALPIWAMKNIFTEESPSIGESYNLARGIARQELEENRENYPIQSLIGEIGGGILGGVGAAGALKSAAPALSGALANFAAQAPIRSGAALGSLTGGVYGFNEGEGGLENRLEDAAYGAALGGITGGATSSLLSRFAKAPDPKRLSADDLREQAGKFYNQATTNGGVLKSNLTDGFIDDARVKILPSTTEGKMLAGKNAIVDELLERIDSFRGMQVTLEGAQEMDEILGDYVNRFVRPNGTLEKEGKKILDVQRAFRDMIENAAESDVIGGKAGFDALKEGRKLWARSNRLRDIENIIERAEMMDQPANAIKSGFNQLLSNKKRLRGYTEQEIAAIRKAAQTGVYGESLRTVGSRLFPIMAGGAAVASGGGALGSAAAAQGASMAARGLGARIRVNQANRVADIIANPELRRGLVNPNAALAGGISGGIIGENLNE